MSDVDADKLFDEIKDAFAYMAKRAVNLGPIGESLKEVLRDWDGAEDDDYKSD
jgi:hypothetical protein